MGMCVVVYDENKKEIDFFKPVNRELWIMNLETDTKCTCGGTYCTCFDSALYLVPKELEIKDEYFNELRKGHEFVYVNFNY